MSESLFYNRDQNISGITVPSELSGMSFTPVYGSKVDFSANNHKYITDDFYYNLIPLSLNSLTAKFNVRYDVNESGARKLATFFESKEGFKPLEFTPDNLGIYKTVSGFCDNYAINFINNQHFEVAASVNVDRAPTLLNWKRGNFANVPFRGWNAGYASFKKYDVIYYRFNPDGTENENKLENFYYCSGDNTPSETNSPTGTSSMWSQKFFFEPDIGVQNDVRIKADVLNYKNSFTQHLKTNSNIATFDMSYTYTDITDRQLKCMLHFLERKGGYRRFEHQIPSVYNRPKVYYCPTWSHTWTYFNSNNLTVDLMEDPLGVIPKAYAGIDPFDNADANTYISAVEVSDSYIFNDPQKGALTDFFNALDTEGLSSKIKKMWLVGFSVNAGLRDVMNPTEVEDYTQTGSAGGDGNPPIDSDMHRGYASFSSDNLVRVNTEYTMNDEAAPISKLGITHTDCGAFVSCTDMVNNGSNYVNAYTAGDTITQFQLKQAGTHPYSTAFRAGYTANVESTSGKQDGVFVVSRNGGDVSLTRIRGAGVAENVTTSKGGGNTSTDTIDLWYGNTIGDVSSVGITSGLTASQTETLAKLIYDLCVGIGHTDLENTT